MSLRKRLRWERKNKKLRSIPLRLTREKNAKKGSGGDSEHDDRVSPHANDDNDLAGNLYNILESKKKSVDEDSNSGLKILIQELAKSEEVRKKSIKI